MAKSISITLYIQVIWSMSVADDVGQICFQSRNQAKIRAISQECSREEISLNLILSSGSRHLPPGVCCPWLRGSISWKNALALLQVGRVRRALHRSSCTTHKARPRYSKGLSGSYAKIPGSGSISLKSSAQWKRLQRPISLKRTGFVAWHLLGCEKGCLFGPIFWLLFKVWAKCHSINCTSSLRMGFRFMDNGWQWNNF